MYQFSPMTERVQRLRERYRSTIPFVDTARYRIVTEFYMQHGEITEYGTHEELLRRCDIYREIYEQQTQGGDENA